MALRVLVVEDDPGTRRVLSALLRQEGYEVEPCEDGVSALERLRTSRYDAVVTDYVMPTITGLDVAREAREVRSISHCVIVSGHAPPDDRPEVAWLSKPVDLDALVGLLPKP